MVPNRHFGPLNARSLVIMDIIAFPKHIKNVSNWIQI